MSPILWLFFILNVGFAFSRIHDWVSFNHTMQSFVGGLLLGLCICEFLIKRALK